MSVMHKAATAASRTAPPGMQKYVNVTYKAHPNPLGFTRHRQTYVMAYDKAHPLHYKVRRKLATFDQEGFHYRVVCKMDLGIKVVRDRGIRRFRVALEDELKAQGLDRSGRPLDPSSTDLRPSKLKGAAVFYIKDLPFMVNAPTAEIHQEAKTTLDYVLRCAHKAHGVAAPRSGPG